MFSAYLKYARSLNLKSELLHSDYGHKIARIDGKKAGFAFRNEPGKHCVQRIPPTESKGRKQTSFVSVAILPVPKEIDIEIPDSDLKIEPVNLGGAGGQHQNRTLSGCRMTYKPLNIVVCINGRDFHSNQREARRVISARVTEMKQSESDAEYAEFRREQQQGGHRSGKVRTYNYLESRVVDHRLGTKTHDVKSILKGQFQKLF